MILHPGALALITGSFIISLLMIYAALFSTTILARWDMNSSSSRQLSMERKSYLLSTIITYALGFEILSLLLYIYTLDEIHALFVGAMCATGSLNANPAGWYVLYMKITVFFLSGIWIAINYIDGKAEDYPLVKAKHALLIFIAPFIIGDAYFVIKYFTGLHPHVITSCCGSLFREESEGMASALASLPEREMMVIFYVAVAIYIVITTLSVKFNKSLFRYAAAILSLLFFFIAMASIISFISLYYYEIPTHHCPFDLLNKDYQFIGYPIYITLFTGVLFGLITGMAQLLGKQKKMESIIEGELKNWSRLSLIAILIFTIISTWPIVMSDFKLVSWN